ncbi:MAG: alkaline phosphatase family protein [Deltaproteobacteria bacterium]|nr:alkaline phosphatase family protein [Deltaproteobacteria bacterium]
MSKSRRKVMVIGLDGATFDIIGPLVDKGELPNIARFMREGAHSRLVSTIHPTTPQAWSTFMTGKNAGKHGIFDFTERRDGAYDVRLVNGGVRRGASLWKLLSQNERTVIVIDVPFTYPAEDVKGALISGLDAPGIDSDFTYPDDLYDEIVRNVGRYDLRGTFPIGKTKSWYRVERLEAVIQNRIDTARYLMKTRDWDFFMMVFGSTDHVQHMFWRYMEDKEKGVDTPDVLAYGDIIPHTYRLVDAAIGEITKEAGSDVDVILMSDHGGGSIKSIVYLNKWLEDEGLLKFKEETAGRGALFNVIKKTRRLMKRRLPSRIKGLLKMFFPGVKDKAESFLYFSKIDWSMTRAYAFGMYGNININLKGREPGGTVSPGQDYENTRDYIIERLMSLACPEDNSRVVERVFKREELFHGPFSDKAPDLLVKWDDYRYFSRVTVDAKEERVFGALFNIDSSDFEYSGTHRLDGIFLANGPDIKRGVSSDHNKPSIVDLAPTILYLMGEPVPEDMDGAVMMDIIKDEFKNSNPLVRGGASIDARAPDRDYSDTEAEEIKNRLHGLGYIE